REFWSLTVYDRATWAFVQNPLDRAQLGSFNKDQMKMNADGSVDLYFGPKAPPGLEANWIPTTGKTPYLWLRVMARRTVSSARRSKCRMLNLCRCRSERKTGFKVTLAGMN